jgi:uncharacterized protein (TIGR03067 family)
MTNRVKLLSALVLVVLSGPLSAARAGDLDLLQGRWKSTMGPSQEVGVLLELQGTDATMTFTKEGSEPLVLRGKISLDEAAQPKALDWLDFVRPDGQKSPVNRAIYAIDGGVLTVVNGGPGNARPTAFPPVDQPAPARAVFQKVAP